MEYPIETKTKKFDINISEKKTNLSIKDISTKSNIKESISKISELIPKDSFKIENLKESFSLKDISVNILPKIELTYNTPDFSKRFFDFSSLFENVECYSQDYFLEDYVNYSYNSTIMASL